MFQPLTRIVALALLASTPTVQADSLGEAVNLSIGPTGAAALAELPPEALEVLHSASSLLNAHGLGLVSDETTAQVLASLTNRMIELHPRLDELDEAPYRVAIILESRVLVAGTRDFVSIVRSGPERAMLLEANSRFTQVVAAGAERRLHSGADGPDNACFQQYAACMDYCSNLDGFFQRSLCGMDCNLDFAACLGTAAGRGIGNLIDVFGNLSRGSRSTAGR